ncbi:MAG: hypothetical protein LBJ62_06875 [Bifidobacteriaceae bacterium]|jgi:hypothetical protein|nr:hypothetical protein [Bifidobacteriaceae bacterium]
MKPTLTLRTKPLSCAAAALTAVVVALSLAAAEPLRAAGNEGQDADSIALLGVVAVPASELGPGGGRDAAGGESYLGGPPGLEGQLVLPCEGDADPVGCEAAAEITLEEWAQQQYEWEHRFDGVKYGDVFTDRGVVIDPFYMDWYIEKVMLPKDPTLIVHSNPGAYLVDNGYYDALVGIGPAGIPRLEKAMVSADNGGLSVYLFGLALEDISGVDMAAIRGEQFRWSTAGSFLDKWFPVKENAAKDIQAIVASKDLTNAAKLTKISNYGILAVPALDQLKDSKSLDKELKAGIEKQLDGLGASDQQQVKLITNALADSSAGSEWAKRVILDRYRTRR